MKLRNTAWKLTSLVAGGGLLFLFTLSLMRHLGPADFGLWAFAISWTGLFSVLVDFGFNPLILRDLSRDPRQGPEYFRTVLRSKVCLALLSAIALGLSFLASHQARSSMALLAGALIYLIATSIVETGQAFTHAYERFKSGTVMATVYKFGVAATGLVSIAAGFSVGGIMASICVASLVGVAFNLWMLNTHVIPSTPSTQTTAWKSLWKAALPLFLQNVFIQVYFKIDTVMLTSMRGLEETGVYSAAYRFFELSNLLPTALLAAHVASLSRSLKQPQGFQDLRRTAFLFLGAALLGIAVLAFASYGLGAGWVGSGFGRSRGVLLILSVALLFYYPNYLFNATLVLLDRTQTIVRVAGAAVVFNVLTNWYAIPRWGAIGSAWATVATEALISGGCLWAILRFRRDADQIG